MRKRRDYLREAKAECFSFFQDGYRLVVYNFDNAKKIGLMKLRHPCNGNTVIIKATEKGFDIYKNGTNVKTVNEKVH